MASPVTKGGGAVDSRDAMHLAVVGHPSVVAMITGHNFRSWLVSGDSVHFFSFRLYAVAHTSARNSANMRLLITITAHQIVSYSCLRPITDYGMIKSPLEIWPP